MVLKPVSVGALQGAFINARRIAESMGKSDKETQELSMEWFTQWLQKSYPAQLQALSAEYSINVRLLHGDLAETTSQNILEQPDPEQFDKTLRDLQQLRSKYDTTAAATATISTPERPFQEFPTVVAMAAQVQPTEWVPGPVQAPPQQAGWSRQPSESPTRPAPRPHKHYGPPEGHTQLPQREVQLPDIRTIKPSNEGLTCLACGCGGHMARECCWVYHKDLPSLKPHIPTLATAHSQGDDYFKAVLNQLRYHGFMAKWTEAECSELVRDVIYKAQRRQQDPSRDTYEANKHRYGASPTPPQVSRQQAYGTAPAWMTHPQRGGHARDNHTPA